MQSLAKVACVVPHCSDARFSLDWSCASSSYILLVLNVHFLVMHDYEIVHILCQAAGTAPASFTSQLLQDPNIDEEDVRWISGTMFGAAIEGVNFPA